MVESVFKRIGIIGALANPNFGDDAILEVTLKRIERMYGKNCKIYIFSKDASYSGDRVSDYSMEVVCVDYIHRISLRNHYQVELMEEEGKNLLDTNIRSDNYEYLENQAKGIESGNIIDNDSSINTQTISNYSEIKSQLYNYNEENNKS